MQEQSDYGGDRVYTGQLYSAPSSSALPALPEDGGRGLPPSALRRSLSSRFGGMGPDEPTPAKMKRKISWAGNTVSGGGLGG